MNELALLLFITCLWLWLLLILSRFSLKEIFIGFFLGIIAANCVLAYYFLYPIIPNVAYFFYLNSFLEELFKGLFCYLLFLLFKPKLKNTLLLGASIGLGFAFYENYCYLSPIIALRATFSIVHMLTTMIVSYGIWKKFDSNDEKWYLLIILSTLLHMGWNLMINFIM